MKRVIHPARSRHVAGGVTTSTREGAAGCMSEGMSEGTSITGACECRKTRSHRIKPDSADYQRSFPSRHSANDFPQAIAEQGPRKRGRCRSRYLNSPGARPQLGSHQLLETGQALVHSGRATSKPEERARYEGCEQQDRSPAEHKRDCILGRGTLLQGRSKEAPPHDECHHERSAETPSTYG
jgi:hypothetical protein